MKTFEQVLKEIRENKKDLNELEKHPLGKSFKPCGLLLNLVSVVVVVSTIGLFLFLPQNAQFTVVVFGCFYLIINAINNIK